MRSAVYFQITALLASMFRHAKRCYLWVTGGFFRTAAAAVIMQFAAVFGFIAIKNNGGSIYWQIGWFSIAGCLMLHFGMKLGKFMSSDE